jgi:hypothetical protein
MRYEQKTMTVWVLLFLSLTDDRPPHPIWMYKTQAQCERVRDEVIIHGLAVGDELKCERERK